MNAKQAKEIPIEEILRKVGSEPAKVKKQGNELWYLSPFREERIPSFKVDTQRNEYFDHGEGAGGNPLDLTMRLTGKDVKESLAWLSGKSLQEVPRIERLASYEKPSNPNQLLKAKPLENKALLQYETEERQIPLDIARQYLKEVYYRNNETGKRYFGVGIENLSGGFDIRNKYSKSVVGEKNITFLPGTKPDERVEVVEGTHEFLTLRAMAGKQYRDSIILNSTGMYKEAIAFIQQKGYKAIVLYENNDAGGQFLRQKFKEALGDKVQPQGDLYAPYNDLNDFWKKERHALSADPPYACKALPQADILVTQETARVFVKSNYKDQVKASLNKKQQTSSLKQEQILADEKTKRVSIRRCYHV